MSTRRVERLAETLGVTKLSKSQVSEMAAYLDEQVAAFRNRPLDSEHYTFVRIDALTIKTRGRVVNVHGLIAVGINAAGQREVLGLDMATSEDGAGWTAFLRGLAARGLSSVELVVSDAHQGGWWVRLGRRCPGRRGSAAAPIAAVTKSLVAFDIGAR